MEKLTIAFDDGDFDITEPAIIQLYDQWHEDHETGRIPARAQYGWVKGGGEKWCSLKDANPELQWKVQLFHNGAVVVKMERYRKKPTPEQAVEIARHLVIADVAGQLREWSCLGTMPPLNPPSPRGRPVDN
jgi:hypothetical protein